MGASFAGKGRSWPPPAIAGPYGMPRRKTESMADVLMKARVPNVAEAPAQSVPGTYGLDGMPPAGAPPRRSLPGLDGAPPAGAPPRRPIRAVPGPSSPQYGLDGALPPQAREIAMALAKKGVR